LQIPDWPTDANQEKIFVEGTCKLFFDTSSTVQLLKNIPGVDYDATYNNCVQDMQVIYYHSSHLNSTCNKK
jgi:hypothetical protein